MPNIGVLLKQEISRLARRETRTQIETLKRASAQYRQSIAALRKQIITLERELGRVSRHQVTGPARAAAAESDAPKVRFSAKWLRPAREKLGLSAAEYGKLLGVTGQTVYNWEHGTSEPRHSILQRIAEIRSIGKREAHARLDALKAGKAKSAAPRKDAAGKNKRNGAAAKPAAAGQPGRARKGAPAKAAAKPQRAPSPKAGGGKTPRASSGKAPAATKAKPARRAKTPAAKSPAAAATPQVNAEA
jgi:transcriptional regulator with XRE-family HTH domain